MRILYGVQGTGNGHITRARLLGPALQRHGIEVDYLFSGRPADQYFNMELFGAYRTHTGFTFATDSGQVNLLKTLSQSQPLEFLRDLKALDLSPYDLVISDFEPLTAWAAKIKGKPSIGVAHQYAFTHPVPGREQSKLAHLGIPVFAPVKERIGLHWSAFDHPILPPIISSTDGEISCSPRKVLVYLPFEDTDRVAEFVQTWESYDFYIYCQCDHPVDQKNVHIRPLSRDNFATDLRSCAGIFSSAGFGVCSEAIQAGKHLLVKPLQGQFEQAANAAALKALNCGDSMEGFDELTFDHWLNNLHQRRPIHPWPDTASHIAGWIAEGMSAPLAELVHQVWGSIPPLDAQVLQQN